TASANAIRAVPLEVGGLRRGTFELWHRSSREHPLAGTLTTHFDSGGTTSSFTQLLGADDRPYSKVKKSGLTLADCLSGLPLMSEYIQRAGLPSYFVRGVCTGDVWNAGEPNWRGNANITFHPNDQNADLIAALSTSANYVDRIHVAEVSTGLRITLEND